MSRRGQINDPIIWMHSRSSVEEFSKTFAYHGFYYGNNMMTVHAIKYNSRALTDIGECISGAVYSVACWVVVWVAHKINYTGTVRCLFPDDRYNFQ